MNMQIIRNNIHRVFRSFGWEVQRVSTVAMAQKIAQQQKQLQQWRFACSYSPKTILDIGANEGQFATLIRNIVRDAKIYSFEPLKQCFENLCHIATPLAPFEAFPYALGSESGSTSIHRNEFSPSSSLLAMEGLHRAELPHTARTITEEIEVRRLDDLSLSLVDPIFVKIDVQGYEMHVLTGGIDTIRRAKAVVVEISSLPLYVGAPTFDEIYRFLTVECGFIYRGNVDQWVSHKDGRILQMDCLFEKP
jgi:FkbM family methyltransferase